jgi:hypothetical protein
MTTETPRFDDRVPDRDFERWRLATEHYIDVVRHAVRARLADDDHPAQAMLDGAILIEAWLGAAGEPGYGSARALLGRLDALLDTLATRLDPSAQLNWLRTPTDVLDGVPPDRGHRPPSHHAVLALARSLPDPPAPSTPPTARDG